MKTPSKRISSPDIRKLFLELLVVFLGVTAGFLLNNWREESNHKKLEYLYLRSFVQNIDTNLVTLEEMLAGDTSWFDTNEKNLRRLFDPAYPVDSLGSVLPQIVGVSSVMLQTNTYEDIKFSGNLNLIADYALKENIVSYHKRIEEIQYIDSYYNSFFSEMVLPHIVSEFNFSDFSLLNNDPNSQARFANVFAAFYSLRKQRSDNLASLLADTRRLRQEIESYIGEK